MIKIGNKTYKLYVKINNEFKNIKQAMHHTMEKYTMI